MPLTSTNIRLTSVQLRVIITLKKLTLWERKIVQKRNQEFANKYYRRGVGHSESGDYDCAIADYTQAIELNSNFAQAYYQRGVAYSQKGELDKAIQDYTQAIELKSDYADAYYSRGGAFLRLGEREKAEADLAIARNMGADAITALDKILQDYDRAWKALGNS